MPQPTRHAAGVAVIAAAWALGEAMQAVTGFPAPVAGLLILTLALVVRPQGLERVGPTADLVIRWLPLLFVPVAVGGAAAIMDVDAGALAAAVVVSVPTGFVLTAWVAR